MHAHGLARLVVFVCWAAAGLLSGCATGTPAAAPASVAQTVSINSGGGTADFPIVGGYSATFAYSANNGGGATAVLSTATAPQAFATVPGGAQPGGIQLASFTFELSRRVRFAQWHRLPTTVSLPPMFPAAGRYFQIDAYDLTRGIGIGENPGSVTGNVIAFPNALGPVTLDADRYLLVLLMF